MELLEEKAGNMAILHCRSCGGDISSDARRSPCRSCGALFPFQCAVCERNLRTPFPVLEDERYLSLDKTTPLPLCADHFLRKCPDCDSWFNADDNPGFFRCGPCAEKAQSLRPALEEEYEEEFESASHEPVRIKTRRGSASPVAANARFNSNSLVLAAAGFAFVALMAWSLIGR